MLALEAVNGILREIYPERQNGGMVVNLNYIEEIIPRYNDDQFHSHFRMHRGTYMVNIDLYLIIIVSKYYVVFKFIYN